MKPRATPSRHRRAALWCASVAATSALFVFALRLYQDGGGALSSPSSAQAIRAGSGSGSRSLGLIYDIGMNDGTDSALYLSQGYRVVAVEANPLLVGQAAGRFIDSVFNGMLTLLNVGVVDDAAIVGGGGGGGGTNRFGPALPFYVHKTVHVWSSMMERWGCRSHNASAPASPENCDKIMIPTTSCAELVRAFGRAVYMKIDIEGHDNLCFLSVANTVPHLLPQYVSIENVSRDKVEMFAKYGYTKFKFVAMSGVFKKPTIVSGGHNRGSSGATGVAAAPASSQHGSGLWGEAAMDFETGYEWRTAAEAVERIQQGVPQPPGEWYDMIAAK